MKVFVSTTTVVRLWCVLFLLSNVWVAQAQQQYHRVLKLMGSRFDITVVAADAEAAAAYIDMAVGEMQAIEALISSWDEHSQTAEINRMAGVAPVHVDKALFDLIERAIAVSRLTDGAFDISYASMDKLWVFDGSMQAMPSSEQIAASVRLVGYRHIVLDKVAQTVYLERAGMKIGFGAIGKGYAADCAKQLLMRKGVEAGVINASGDMSVWGCRPNGKPWTVAITNPFDKAKSCGVFPLAEGAVVTSGNYEKYVTFAGKRYTHIIDPRTGMPSSGLQSVTVFAPKAELADALATSVFVMGKDVGLDRINQLPQVECIIIDDKGVLSSSKNIDIENSAKAGVPQ